MISNHPATRTSYIYIDVEKIMYEEANKVIYVTLEASLLFWTKLSKIL